MCASKNPGKACGTFLLFFPIVTFMWSRRYFVLCLSVLPSLCLSLSLSLTIPFSLNNQILLKILSLEATVLRTCLSASPVFWLPSSGCFESCFQKSLSFCFFTMSQVKTCVLGVVLDECEAFVFEKNKKIMMNFNLYFVSSLQFENPKPLKC